MGSYKEQISNIKHLKGVEINGERRIKSII